jgi:hypothetical protein
MEKLNNCEGANGFIDEISIIDEAAIKSVLDNRIPNFRHHIITFTTSKEDSKKAAAKLADIIKNHPVITKQL